MTESLTQSLEDYLEIILQLSKENGTAKVSDIAQRLGIAKPSVTQAVASLRREGLVTQTPYGPVALTEKGKTQAQEVWHRHQVISLFLSEILHVPAAIAEHDACMMEHIISPETFSSIAAWLGEEQSAGLMPIATVPLGTLLPGQKAKIVKIQGQSTPAKHRIMKLGLVPGVKVEVERLAPLGDPMEIKINDYHLSLRREEAALLQVELIQD